MKVDENIHDVLYSEAALLLGEIHWMILKATHAMDKERWNEIPVGFAKQYEDTEFGKEVGLDEIHWWIFRQEKDVDELVRWSEEALKAVHTLQVAATRLRKTVPETYEGLLGALRKFADDHQKEIDILHKYVTWLESRHPMAPRILFTYRIWGSTRMADREMDLSDVKSPREDIGRLRTATEIVLGVFHRSWRTWDRVYGELQYEAYEGVHPEEVGWDYVPAISEGRVVRMAAIEIYDNCAVYFSELRRSLWNIVLDAKKMKQQFALFNSEKFWQGFIPKAAKTKMSEPQLWDFKETLTIWHVNEEEARKKARITFAEDVASFANASGGVLIVGVTDKREIAGIGDGKDVENRVKAARDVLTEIARNSVESWRPSTVISYATAAAAATAFFAAALASEISSDGISR
jgi:DNA-binding transcriptional regulator/RsmH inhibitor MraZ